MKDHKGLPDPATYAADRQQINSVNVDMSMTGSTSNYPYTHSGLKQIHARRSEGKLPMVHGAFDSQNPVVQTQGFGGKSMRTGVRGGWFCSGRPVSSNHRCCIVLLEREFCSGLDCGPVGIGRQNRIFHQLHIVFVCVGFYNGRSGLFGRIYQNYHGLRESGVLLCCAPPHFSATTALGRGVQGVMAFICTYVWVHSRSLGVLCRSVLVPFMALSAGQRRRFQGGTALAPCES